MEKHLQQYCKARARLHGISFFKLVAIGQRGFPDVMLIAPRGRIVFLELKNPNNTQGVISESQRRIISTLCGLGCDARVVQTKLEIDHVIETICDENV